MMTALKAVQGENARTTHHEKAENYSSVVYREGSWRVIECREGIQWIIQGRRGAEWKSKSYCTTREALNRDWRRHSGALGNTFDHLPERIGACPHG